MTDESFQIGDFTLLAVRKSNDSLKKDDSETD